MLLPGAKGTQSVSTAEQDRYTTAKPDIAINFAAGRKEA